MEDTILPNCVIFKGRVGRGRFWVGSTIESSPGGVGGCLNEIIDVGPIRAGGRKRTPNVRLQDHE